MKRACVCFPDLHYVSYHSVCRCIGLYRRSFCLIVTCFFIYEISLDLSLYCRAGQQLICPRKIPVEQTMSTLAECLAVEETALESMLTQRVVVTRGETFTIQLSLDDANLTRDAIVKSLYEVRTPSYTVYSLRPGQ